MYNVCPTTYTVFQLKQCPAKTFVLSKNKRDLQSQLFAHTTSYKSVNKWMEPFRGRLMGFSFLFLTFPL